MKTRPGPAGRAVVLLSGGIDSSTVLAIAKAEGLEIHALSFDYHQRHRRELRSAKMVAEAFGVHRHLIVSFDLREIGRSALTADIAVPKAGRDEIREAGVPVTYVPARNTIFLSFGLAWAEVLGADRIFIGANAVDYSGYPDCRPEYLRAFEEMANLATKASVEGGIRFRIQAPLLSLKKSEIILKGRELGLDYALTWSCYDPVPEKGLKAEAAAGIPETGFQDMDYVPCGQCDSCLFREKGFREAGIRDPLLSIVKS